MKKIALLFAFCVFALIGSAQVNVGNATDFPILVGVQYSDIGSCVPGPATWNWILPDENFLFIPPPGMAVLFVGVDDDVFGMGYDYPLCGTCGPSAPGLFSFNWSPDCSHVKINL